MTARHGTATVRRGYVAPADLDILDMPQGSPEWYEVRCGVPTASRFADVMAQGEGKSRTRYLRDIVGERLSQIPCESYENAAMARGKRMEELARQAYVESTFQDCRQIGFARRTALLRYDVVGASPDLLVGDDGLAEFKSTSPHLLIEVLERGARGFPPEHRAQCQGTMLVTDRRWCDLVLFWPGFPPCKFRVERDDRYCSELVAGLETFCFEARELVKRLEAMKGRAAA